MNNKVLVCKAKPPIEGAEVVAEEISRAHRYYNLLIELHRTFRASADDLKRRHIPGLSEAEAGLEAASQALHDLLDDVRRRNGEARRKQANKEDREALWAAREAVKAARAERKRLRALAASNAGYQMALDALVIEYQGVLQPGASRRQGGCFKDARAVCGVYPGTYLRIEAAVEQTVKTSLGEPRFRRWTGDGLVGPQLTPPLSVRDLLAGGDTRLRLELLPSPQSERRSQRVLWHVRIQSDGRVPVWAVIPAHLSRGQLPDDALITWASIIRRQVGVRRQRDPDVPEGVYRPYYEWSVQLTYRTGTDVRERASFGACGVNLGWRLLPEGSLRVATVVGDDSAVETLTLTPSLLGRWARARDIQSIRDKQFDAVRNALAKWLADHPSPDWLREATIFLRQWRSPRRLGGVQGQWSRQRFAGDEAMFAALTEWRQHDVHLEQYALMLVRKAERARLSLYRGFVADLCRRYRIIVVDDTEQQKLVRLPRPENNEPVNETARFNARIASPGLLRRLLVQAGAALADPMDITRLCHVCGSREIWDQARELEHTCVNGHTWDQDENAARNLLARAGTVDDGPGFAREPQGPDGNGDGNGSPKAGGKWARRKAARSQRLLEQQQQTVVESPAVAMPSREA